MASIEIDDRIIHNYGKSGKPFVYNTSETPHIILSFKKDALSLDALAPQDLIVKAITKLFMFFEAFKDVFSKNVSMHSLTAHANDTIYALGAYISSESAITLNTPAIIDLRESLLKAPAVSLINNAAVLDDCFIYTNRFELHITDPNSAINTVSFYAKDAPIIIFGQGRMGMTDAETDLVIIGACEIIITFTQPIVA
jgi:hypothetical protein